ncbi:nectin-1-like isoform X2 [Phyllobates terribilis]|uniref:nectin-1-like isoform X2 n=1 Tax=Phyllobates terribilis TaxID=111132 RepID=UPI003CCAA19A
MSLLSLLVLSLSLQAGLCQVRVPGMVYAWLESQMTLDCRADTKEEIKQVTWEKQGSGASVTVLTYRNDTGPKYHMLYENRVRFKGSGYKEGSIEIFNVSLLDEGVFKCVFTTFPSGTMEGRIQLQVLVLPTVKQALKKDFITPCLNLVAECFVSSAKPAAEIKWITNGIHYTSKEENITHSNGTISKRSELYMTTTPDLFGRQVFCLVFQPKIPFEFQNNITINVTLTNIQFPPQTVHIEVLKNDQEVLQLLCTSDGNPRAEFIWKRSDKSEDFLPVPSRILNFNVTPADGLYICEAANALGINRGFFYIYTSKGNLYPIFISILVILGILLLLCVCYLNRYRWPFTKCNMHIYVEQCLGKKLKNNPQGEPSREETTNLGVIQDSERVLSIEKKATLEDTDEESERKQSKRRLKTKIEDSEWVANIEITSKEDSGEESERIEAS